MARRNKIAGATGCGKDDDDCERLTKTGYFTDYEKRTFLLS